MVTVVEEAMVTVDEVMVVVEVVSPRQPQTEGRSLLLPIRAVQAGMVMPQEPSMETRTANSCEDSKYITLICLH